jgi:hypothetical protein
MESSTNAGHSRMWTPPTSFSREQPLTREIERLRGILLQTAWTLKQNGDDTGARRLERALEGR